MKMSCQTEQTAGITAADIETWARVEAAIKGKAVEMCAQGCDHPPSACRACDAGQHPEWRRDALRVIQGGQITGEQP
jgi:hypothetical protein